MHASLGPPQMAPEHAGGRAPSQHSPRINQSNINQILIKHQRAFPASCSTACACAAGLGVHGCGHTVLHRLSIHHGNPSRRCTVNRRWVPIWCAQCPIAILHSCGYSCRQVRCTTCSLRLQCVAGTVKGHASMDPSCGREVCKHCPCSSATSPLSPMAISIKGTQLV